MAATRRDSRSYCQSTADRGRDLPAVGGTVLNRWPDPPAYATQLRLITVRIIAAANQAVDTEEVRAVRALPPDAVPPMPCAANAVPVPATSALSKGPAKTRETPTGYHKVQASYRAARPELWTPP